MNQVSLYPRSRSEGMVMRYCSVAKNEAPKPSSAVVCFTYWYTASRSLKHDSEGQ